MIKESVTLVQELIKTSALLDERGHDKIARELIKCAKKVNDSNLPYVDIISLFGDILEKEGFIEESKLIKEAQGVYDLSLEDVTEGISQIGPFIDSLLARLQEKVGNLVGMKDAKGITKQLGNIWTALNKLKSQFVPQMNQISEQALQVQENMQILTPSSIQIGNKTHPIEFVTDPNDAEWEMAVVFSDNKWYKVQEDAKGKRSLSPIPEENVDNIIPADLQQKYMTMEVEPEPEVEPESASSGVGAGNEISVQQEQERRNNAKNMKTETLEYYVNKLPQDIQKLEKPQQVPDRMQVVENKEKVKDYKDLLQVYRQELQERAASNKFNLKKYAKQI